MKICILWCFYPKCYSIIVKDIFAICLPHKLFLAISICNFLISRLVAPEAFRAPECFSWNSVKILGEPFDLWSYGLLVLNLLTKDYFSIKTYRMLENVSWRKDLWPIVKKVLKVKLNAFVIVSAYAKSIINLQYKITKYISFILVFHLAILVNTFQES